MPLDCVEDFYTTGRVNSLLTAEKINAYDRWTDLPEVSAFYIH